MQVQIRVVTELFFLQLQVLSFSELILHRLFVAWYVKTTGDHEETK